jgi:hypothetical protein
MRCLVRMVEEEREMVDLGAGVQARVLRIDH